MVEPIRKLIARVRGHYIQGVRVSNDSRLSLNLFLEQAAVDIDLENRLIEVAGGDKEHFYIPYDKAVIAVGSTSNTHGVPGLEHTFQLKTVPDVLAIRRRIMENLETAALPTTSAEERDRLMSFVVCGGGPTGVEFASEVYDMSRLLVVGWSI